MIQYISRSLHYMYPHVWCFLLLLLFPSLIIFVDVWLMFPQLVDSETETQWVSPDYIPSNSGNIQVQQVIQYKGNLKMIYIWVMMVMGR